MVLSRGETQTSRTGTATGSSRVAGLQVSHRSLTPTARRSKTLDTLTQAINGLKLLSVLNSAVYLQQDALRVCCRPASGPAASLQLSAAGSVQHQVVRRHQSLQRHPDEDHQHGLSFFVSL